MVCERLLGDSVGTATGLVGVAKAVLGGNHDGRVEGISWFSNACKQLYPGAHDDLLAAEIFA